MGDGVRHRVEEGAELLDVARGAPEELTGGQLGGGPALVGHGRRDECVAHRDLAELVGCARGPVAERGADRLERARPDDHGGPGPDRPAITGRDAVVDDPADHDGHDDPGGLPHQAADHPPAPARAAARAATARAASPEAAPEELAVA